MEPIETFTGTKYELQIITDDDPFDPREEYENFGKMVVWHKNYNLGERKDVVKPSEPENFFKEIIEEFGDDCDRNRILSLEDQLDKKTNDIYDAHHKSYGSYGNLTRLEKEEIQKLNEDFSYKIVTMAEKFIFWLPLYLYEHGSLAIKSGRVSGPWDYRQDGYIYVTKADAKDNYGKKRITKELAEKVYSHLENEVETYNQYLTGDVYFYRIISLEDDAIVDCCGQFFGSDIKENGMLECIPTEYLTDLSL